MNIQIMLMGVWEMGKRPSLDHATIEKIKALLATGKSKNAVARELGVSWATVNKYAKKEADDLESLREQKKKEFINAAWDDILAAMRLGRQKIRLATVATEEFEKRIDELVNLLKKNPQTNGKDVIELIKALSTITSIPLNHISTYFGTLYDKQALATGEATDRKELTGKDGGPIKTETQWDLSNLTDEELDLLEEITEKAAESQGGS